MKKIMCICLIIILMGGVIGDRCIRTQAKGSAESSDVQKDIAKKIIRFHILANSDSDEDQALKLKVKDKVIEYMAPKLKSCKNITEARNILLKNNSNIINIANKVIKANKYYYGVRTEFSEVNFPVKSYGDIVLPQGEYTAYRILIGKAAGHNWWCVMFPPLCFTDITKGEIEEEKTRDEMKSVLTKDEFKVVDNAKKENNIKVRFKLVDEIENLAKKISAEFR
ncbi:stage II sporulation protein R [Clostridium hydrogenum]|uniref:stage II sporulation protein R n=1 Tax=Clostridium hydrogenum TaxID=2855764 RepID=UPI001F373764|nr:stage II sporulation protein R [Clostridium hydrogenum]